MQNYVVQGGAKKCNIHARNVFHLFTASSCISKRFIEI